MVLEVVANDKGGIKMSRIKLPTNDVEQASYYNEDEPNDVVYLSKHNTQLTDPELVKIYRKICEIAPPGYINYVADEIGISEIFTDTHIDMLRYCEKHKKWYIYENGRWVVDTSEMRVHNKVQVLLRLLELYCDESQKDLSEYKKTVRKCMSDPIIRRILHNSRFKMMVDATDFDSDPYLLNCTNGVYNMRDKSFRFATPDDLFTLSTACYYPHAYQKQRCEEWEQFISDIMENDKDKALFLQRALGYSLLGINREECMFVAYGKTRAGKGTLFNTIAKILGMNSDKGYSGTINSAFICYNKYKDKDYNAAQPMLAETVGLRYVTMSETKEGAVLDANGVKSITGRDPLQTRRLHCEPFIFTPQFTMWLSTNSLPKVTDNTVFKSDRIWVIEFNKHFDKEERNRDLSDIFMQEENQAAIFRWLLDGYEMYAEQGLNPPPCIIEATERYERQNDVIMCFKDDCLEDAPGERVSNALMYNQYKSWCIDEERGYRPMGSTTFYGKLSKHYTRIDSHGFRGFEGVKIKAERLDNSNVIHFGTKNT